MICSSRRQGVNYSGKHVRKLKGGSEVDRDYEDPCHQLNHYDGEHCVSSRAPGSLLCG